MRVSATATYHAGNTSVGYTEEDTFRGTIATDGGSDEIHGCSCQLWTHGNPCCLSAISSSAAQYRGIYWQWHMQFPLTRTWFHRSGSCCPIPVYVAQAYCQRRFRDHTPVMLLCYNTIYDTKCQRLTCAQNHTSSSLVYRKHAKVAAKIAKLLM